MARMSNCFTFSTVACVWYYHHHYDNTIVVIALCSVIVMVMVSAQMNSEKCLHVEMHTTPSIIIVVRFANASCNSRSIRLIGC